MKSFIESGFILTNGSQIILNEASFQEASYFLLHYTSEILKNQNGLNLINGSRYNPMGMLGMEQLSTPTVPLPKMAGNNTLGIFGSEIITIPSLSVPRSS